jgi:CheY-like chemotaxis protein
LALARVSKAKPVAEPENTSADQPHEAVCLQVLAAEDNEVNRTVLRTLLVQFGLDPFIVEDGQQAVEAWSASDWDVILMDVQMPVMDGVSATKLIRAREAALGRRRTPIIALTANALSHQVADYRAAGMDAVVAKPIELRKLLEALEFASELGEAADPAMLRA